MTNFLKDTFLPPPNCYNRPIADTKERLHYLDLAKGVCIILMVMYHVDLDKPFYLHFLTQLRMPLYFFLSGVFFRPYDSPITFLKKKASNLLVPAIFFDVLYFSIKFATISDLDLTQFHITLLSGYVNNAPLWFLIALFNIAVIFYFITKLPYKARYICIAVCPFLLYFFRSNNIDIPFYIDETIWGLPFYCIGSMLSTTRIIRPGSHDNKLALTGGIIFTAIVIIVLTLNLPIVGPYFGYSWDSPYNNPIASPIISITMVISFVLMCKGIKWLPFVSYCGRYSIILLVTHMMLTGYIDMPYHQLTHQIFTYGQRTVAVILACWLLIPLFVNYLPYVCAQKNIFDYLKTRRTRLAAG